MRLENGEETGPLRQATVECLAKLLAVLKTKDRGKLKRPRRMRLSFGCWVAKFAHRNVCQEGSA